MSTFSLVSIENPSSRGLSSDPLVLLDKFNDFIVRGDTALYDACYVAIDKLQSGRHARAPSSWISDWAGQCFCYSYSELRNLLKETDVLVY